MAEIKIEKKKPVWPWVLLVLIIIGAIAYFVYENNEDDGYADDVTDEQMDTLNDGTMNDSITYEDTMTYPDSTDVMMTYSESIKDSTRIGTDSTYTKTALYNLAKATIIKAESYQLENTKALDDLKSFTSQMDGMSDSTMPKPTGLKKNLKSVSSNIVNVLEAIQAKKFPTLQKEVANLKQTANNINEMSLEKQQSTLQSFFRRAHEVLNNMNS